MRWFLIAAVAAAGLVQAPVAYAQLAPVIVSPPVIVPPSTLLHRSAHRSSKRTNHLQGVNALRYQSSDSGVLLVRAEPPGDRTIRLCSWWKQTSHERIEAQMAKLKAAYAVSDDAAEAQLINMATDAEYSHYCGWILDQYTPVIPTDVEVTPPADEQLPPPHQ
ncbi:MAG: hypothetical protein JWN49_699 [Parcubacteria group bacterium]|nr:hypothetical protein [Parcubacteria group bacterium]